MRLAHLSDCHILEGCEKVHGDIDTAARLAYAVEAVNAFGDDLDAVIFTGDLTGRPSRGAYEKFKSLVAPLKLPFFLIPGNHDDRNLLRDAFSGAASAPYKEGFAQYVVDDFPVRLVALDSTIPGSDVPEFCVTRASWLDEQLTAKPDRPTLLFIHHPPISLGVSMVDDVVPADWARRLSDIVGRHPQVHLIACGHVHASLSGHLHGARVSLAPSTAFQLRHRLGRDSAPECIDRPGEITVHYWTGVSFITVSLDLEPGSAGRSIETLMGMPWRDLKDRMRRHPK